MSATGWDWDEADRFYFWQKAFVAALHGSDAAQAEARATMATAIMGQHWEKHRNNMEAKVVEAAPETQPTGLGGK